MPPYNTEAHLTVCLLHISLVALSLDFEDLVVFRHLTRPYALDYRKVLGCVLPFLLLARRFGGRWRIPMLRTRRRRVRLCCGCERCGVCR